MKKDVVKIAFAYGLLFVWMFTGWRGYSPLLAAFGWLCGIASVILFFSLEGSNAISEIAKEFFSEEN